MHGSASTRLLRSMAYRVRVTGRARRELLAAIGYIAVDLDSPNAANDHLGAFRAALETLETMPRFRPIDRGVSITLGNEIRWFGVKQYRALYFIDEDAQAVTVFSFVHMRQDYGKIVAVDYDSRG